jgi:hypothetical protein
MNIRRSIMAVFILLVIAGTWLAIPRVWYLAETADNPGRVSCEKQNTPASTDSEVEMEIPETAANPLCAPGSTVYLTQAQQEYSLGERGPDSPEVKAAKPNGADTKVTLRVGDSRGNPVPGADVQIAFFHRGSHPANGKTDASGFFTAEHRSGSDVHFYASKDGYYNTQRNYWFYREGKPCAKDGRWIPWNPTLEVVLKEKRNPIRLFEKTADIELPMRGKRYGFDFAIGELVEPDGKGKNADIWLFCDGSMSYPPTQNFTNELTISAGQPFEGFALRRKDMWSEMVMDYEAPADGYSQQFSLTIKRATDKIFENKELSSDEYLVFKTRARIQEKDQICASYGMIHGPIHYGVKSNDREGARVILHYFFNPTVNDKNLESKPERP